MPADRRLFDSSCMTLPPAPDFDVVTCTVETPERICTGRPPFPGTAGHAAFAGCGAVLTFDEFIDSGCCCNKCDERWLRRLEAWRGSAPDEHFGPVRELYSYIAPYNQVER